MFYLKLLELCRINNIQVTTLLKEIKMSSGNLSKWKNGNIPKMDTVLKIAQYFNVNVDYFFDVKEIQDNKLQETLTIYDTDTVYNFFDTNKKVLVKDEKANMNRHYCPYGYFYCKVSDDYMKNAGLTSKSIVLVKEYKKLLNEQIACIVLLNGNITFRRYKNRGFYSESDITCNLTQKDIFKILGYAVEVINIL